jgi:hypothetical protein
VLASTWRSKRLLHKDLRTAMCDGAASAVGETAMRAGNLARASADSTFEPAKASNRSLTQMVRYETIWIVACDT